MRQAVIDHVRLHQQRRAPETIGKDPDRRVEPRVFVRPRDGQRDTQNAAQGQRQKRQLQGNGHAPQEPLEMIGDQHEIERRIIFTDQDQPVANGGFGLFRHGPYPRRTPAL